MFPLKKRFVGGYKFRQRTTYSRYHLGTDWRAYYEPLYAPTDGEIIKTPWGAQGGQWLLFKNKFNNIHRFGHLSEIRTQGKVKEGEIIAITGNTGLCTTAPHLHEDITKAGGKVNIYDINNFIDPEKFYNNLKLMKTYRITSKLRTAIKDITGKDRKKMDDKELQEKTAKDLDKKRKLIEDLEVERNELAKLYNKLSENYNESLKLINDQRTEIQEHANAIERKDAKIDEIIKGNARLEETIDELENEMKKLKALNELSAKNVKVVEALRFLYKVITS